MKKLLITLALLIASPAYGAYTLFEYYGGNLPSVYDRTPAARECGITNYVGSYDQNIRFLDCLQSGVELGFAPTTGYSKRLSESISAVDTIIPVTSVSDSDGLTLPCTATNKCYFNIEQGTSKEERVVCTGVSSLTFTGCTRGLVATGASETGSSTLAVAHNAGSRIIMTNIAQFFSNYVDTTTAQSIAGVKTLTSSPIIPEPTSNSHAATKYYVDNVALQGGATSTETVMGLVELGTVTEAARATWNANRPTVLTTQMASSSLVAEVPTVVVTKINDGHIDQSFIDLTENFTFEGNNTYSGISSFTGSTTLSNVIIASSTLNQYPTASTSPTTKGYVDASVKGSIYCFNSTDTLAVPDTGYIPYFYAAIQATGTSTALMVTRSGVVRNMYVHPYTNNAQYGPAVYRAKKNDVNTSLTVSITAGSTAKASDTSNSFSVVAGDTISIYASNDQTGTGGTTATVCIQLDAQ